MIKKVLLLYKQSIYKYYYSNQRHKNLFKDETIAKRFMKTHDAHYNSLAKVEGFFKTHKISYSKLLRGRKTDFSQYGLIVTVGGDGTFLEGASQVTTQLMLGINSDPQWSVGRFCSASSDNFGPIILNVLAGKYKKRVFNRMKVIFKDRKITVTALNDILLCHRNPAAMSRYYLQFRNKKEDQRSSGVWVATAAGSTGAIRSAGGQVLAEESTKLQYVTRELHYGKMGCSFRRTAILNANEKLQFTSLMKDGVVYVDGSHICFPFAFGEKVTIQKSNNPLKVVIA